MSMNLIHIVGILVMIDLIKHNNDSLQVCTKQNGSECALLAHFDTRTHETKSYTLSFFFKLFSLGLGKMMIHKNVIYHIQPYLCSNWRVRGVVKH